jgi:hypothetical protein
VATLILVFATAAGPAAFWFPLLRRRWKLGQEPAVETSPAPTAGDRQDGISK